MNLALEKAVRLLLVPPGLLSWYHPVKGAEDWSRQGLLRAGGKLYKSDSAATEKAGGWLLYP